MEEYEIHANGGRPFTVKINDDFVDVYICSCRRIGSNKIMSIPYEKVFVGKDDSLGKNFDGNSILVKKNDQTYIYIGDEIYSFKPEEEIIEYHSPVGNSDVPYPYACSVKNTYLMAEYVKISNELRESDIEGRFKDPYAQYYGPNGHNSKFKKFKKIILQERL